MTYKLRHKVMACVVSVTLALGLCPGFAMAGEGDAPEVEMGLTLSGQDTPTQV